MIEIGDKLDKYEITQVLGQGAMGVVYLAHDPIIDRRVAIKVLHPHHCQGPNGAELSIRFQREAQAAARCMHQNIVTVFDYGMFNDQNYLVMEYIDGEELSDLLQGNHKLTLDEAIFITLCVLRALNAAHQNNIVHRDIKPANIILLNNGEVKLTDFGVALLDKSDLTISGNMVGTPNYMSPEGLRGETVTHQADIYSAAMVMLEMLTGARLSPQQLYTLPISEFLNQVFETQSNLSPALQAILRKALASKKSERYQSALDFISAIDGIDKITSTQGELPPATLINSTPTPSHLKIAKSALQDIQLTLTKHLGPITNLVIKKTLTTSRNPEQFMLSLAGHISDSQEREQFINKAQTSLSISTTQPMHTTNGDLHEKTIIEQSNSTLASPLTKLELDNIATELAYFLGPIAKHQVKKHAKQQQDPTTLCHQLAALIPMAEERKIFLKNVVSK
jgi:serine/threonine-protein kinase